MAWQTPKTDWATDDAVGTTDLNRIELNSQHLNGSDDDLVGMETVSSAASITLAKKFTRITGATAIKYISTAGFVRGALLYLLIVHTSLVIHHNEGAPGAGFANIIIATGADAVFVGLTTAGLIVIQYDGTNWNLMGNHSTS
jgi:hypothetical protein